jgi:phosphatidylcholine synthase
VLWSAQYHLTFHAWGGMPAAYVGFPAAWNVVAFYLHAFDATPVAAVLVIGSGVIASLIPIPWPHPLRVMGWTHVGRVIVMIWLGTAAVTLWTGFPTTPAAKAVFLLSLGAYLATVVKVALDERVPTSSAPHD